MTGEYSAAELCRILHLTPPQLRACLRAALLPRSHDKAPCAYTFQDLIMLRTAKGLTDAGVPVAQIRKVLEGLQRQLGEGQAMTSLKIYASGKRVVVWDGASRWQPDSGQFLLNFDTAQMLTSRTLTPRQRPPATPTRTRTVPASTPRPLPGSRPGSWTGRDQPDFPLAKAPDYRPAEGIDCNGNRIPPPV